VTRKGFGYLRKKDNHLDNHDFAAVQRDKKPVGYLGYLFSIPFKKKRKNRDRKRVY
jgi:hypothetical protein